jgi:hypothetical protein
MVFGWIEKCSMFRRLLRVVLKDRITIEFCDSTYGALVYRKFAEGCASTVKGTNA